MGNNKENTAFNYISYLYNQVKADFMDIKYKGISQQSGELLAYFNQIDKPCFTHEEAAKVLQNATKNTVLELLSDMTRRGLLMRLKKGVYYIIP